MVHRLLKIIFDSRMFVIDLNGLKSNLTTALFFEICRVVYEVRRCTAGQRSSPYRGFDEFSLGC